MQDVSVSFDRQAHLDARRKDEDTNVFQMTVTTSPDIVTPCQHEHTPLHQRQRVPSISLSVCTAGAIKGDGQALTRTDTLTPTMQPTTRSPPKTTITTATTTTTNLAAPGEMVPYRCRRRRHVSEEFSGLHAREFSPRCTKGASSRRHRRPSARRASVSRRKAWQSSLCLWLKTRGSVASRRKKRPRWLRGERTDSENFTSTSSVPQNSSPVWRTKKGSIETSWWRGAKE